MDCILTKYEAIKISNARKIVDTRNRIIHGYDSVSDEIIWGIVINHIPILQTEVKGLLEELYNPYIYCRGCIIKLF
jgi:uncharacterized protein with HEPN domain